jgi:hypothetical protein
MSLLRLPDLDVATNGILRDKPLIRVARLPAGRRGESKAGLDVFATGERAAVAVELGPGLGGHGDGFADYSAAFDGAELSASAFAFAAVFSWRRLGCFR